MEIPVYILGSDSLPRDGVPRGKITVPKTIQSKIFPGTAHMYTVYVPAQYDPSKPACLMIFQDGHAYADLNGEFQIPNVFDNLIYQREMPVTIAVFINPGHTPDQPDFSVSFWNENSNRLEEFHTLDDRYSQVILQELMPELNQSYNISKNPDDRALTGTSSGAMAAFTVAWRHPDEFHKIITTIGTFTAVSGGNVYPSLIRKSDKKPLRIFMEDCFNSGKKKTGVSGSHSQNLKMLQALTEKGYDVNYAWARGAHTNQHGGAIMPEMLRWLWRDYQHDNYPADAGNCKPFVPTNTNLPRLAWKNDERKARNYCAFLNNKLD